jgi:DNA-binding LacI/PurR family transcriptional regulator
MGRRAALELIARIGRTTAPPATTIRLAGEVKVRGSVRAAARVPGGGS